MKPLKLLAFVLLGTLSAHAQSTADPKQDLFSQSFSRMIVQDITYAIVGENAPVSGVKIDVSKPEGTISAMFPNKAPKWYFPFEIFGFELKGGVADKNFSFFKGTNANAAFEFRPSFHTITWGNSALYGYGNEAKANKKLVIANNDLVLQQSIRQRDTFFVLTELYNHHFQVLKSPKKGPTGIVAADRHKKIAEVLLQKLLDNKSITVDSKLTWDQVLKLLPQATVDGNGSINTDKDYYPELVELYKKYEKADKKRKDNELDKMVANSDGLWTRKRYSWWSFNPFVKTEKVNEYYTTFEDKDSLYFKPDYRWTYGVSVYFNKYWLTPNKIAVLLRGGPSLAYSNNVSNLSSFNYEIRTPFFQNGSSQTEKIKTGTAYNNSAIKEGWERQLVAEFYLLPLNSFVPGLYLAGNIANSDLYKLPGVVGRADDTWKAGAEGGLVFNINNREKDKSLLSIITYFRYEDFTDKTRTDAITGIEEPRRDFQKRNIGMGIKIGIPITLPRRTE